MAKLNIEYFVARRLRGSGESKGVMARIAVATTAVSLAVMILAVAVIMGFRAEISGKITAFTGHLKVQALDYGAAYATSPITLSPALEADIAALDGVRSVGAFALKLGVAKTDDATHGLMLKGVDAEADLSLFEQWLVAGTLPRRSETIDTSARADVVVEAESARADSAAVAPSVVRHKDILISESVGRMLRLGVDDRVEMLFVEGDRPRRDRFRVCGLYSSGFGEMDDNFALTDIAAVQRLNNWSRSQIAGYEVVIDNMEHLAGVEQALLGAILPHDTGDPPLMVRSVTGDFPLIFDWLATHDVNAAVIIAIMVVVALVSMISALLIILLERIRMIGVLKTLGMRNGSLRRIFVTRAARIVVTGLIIGNVVGVGAALAQARFGVLKLDSAGYFVSQVPIELGWWWILALNVGVALVLVALMIFPTSIVGRITPEKTIRYQ
jgi:lipoprotein-releasing system permease protein